MREKGGRGVERVGQKGGVERVREKGGVERVRKKGGRRGSESEG